MIHLTTLLAAACLFAACSVRPSDGKIPRGKAPEALDKAFAEYLDAVERENIEIHSIMVVQHGKVLEEKFFVPDTAHILNSVSKTFTATAVGFAISEGYLSLDDKITELFSTRVPAGIDERAKDITIRHLLTMNSGHGTDPTYEVRQREDNDWVTDFLYWPMEFEPGTAFCYNSLGTYVLSAAVQVTTGEKVVDYLDSRLWQPLGIEKPFWQESPEGVNTGGWGLYLHTEDLAKMGLCLLGGGVYNGRQVIPEEWVREMTARQVPSVGAGLNEHQVQDILADPDNPRRQEFSPETSDWVQGYGYQMWRCRHGAFRADGANGQFILVLPDKDAVIAITADTPDMQKELNQVWDYIYPAL